jgi:vitamin B12/bleomycin/antimicrobial peptide transport system ATP-binding/permease protein
MESVAARATAQPCLQVVPTDAAGIQVDRVDLALPNGRVILSKYSLTMGPSDRLLITGPNGSGKTTLFRALAGIWPFRRGRVEEPARARMLFLPHAVGESWRGRHNGASDSVRLRRKRCARRIYY